MPARAHRTAKKDLHPRFKIWLESRGKAVIGEGRVELLQAIGDTGSLVEAAERTGLSYRRAWGKLRDMEQSFGAPLVHSEKGGSARGGTRLTSEGQALVRQYRRLRKLIESDLRREFNEVFSA
jgi:molybdate transport system regulatory protein